MIGAFGMVHKGDMTTSDGSVKAVAIKTIKCTLVFCFMYSVSCSVQLHPHYVNVEAA